MPRRKLVCAVALSAAFSAHAQWQLPPGTSSSAPSASEPASASTGIVQQAEQLLETQDWQGAARLLRPVAAQRPNDAHVQYDLGFALDNGGDAAGAKQAYEAATKADSTLVSARVSLGLLLARQGDTDAAARWLREAVALDKDAATRPARAQAERALARIDLTAKPEQARDELLAAISLSSEQPDDLELGGAIAESLHDDPAAERAYARAVQATPTDPNLAAAYARVLLRQGKVPQAEAVLQRGLAQHPDNPALLSEQADLLLSEKRFESALPLLERLHSADAANAALSRLLARAYVAAGDAAKADPLFAALLREAPDDAVLLTDWADSLIRQKRNPEAEQVLTHALTLSFPRPQDKADAAAKLAFAASVDHHPETVVRAVQLRDAILPPDAASTFLLAAGHDTLHHTAQAAEKYREFIQLAGQAYPDEVWQAQQRLQVLRRAK